MKIIVITYEKTHHEEDKFGYYFENDAKQYSYLFRNLGMLGVNGIRTVDPPEEIIQWFKDIKGDDMSTASGYGVKNATAKVEKCNENLGCSSRCDYSQKQKCELLDSLEHQRQELDLTIQFMEKVLNNGFDETNTAFYFNKHNKIKQK